MYIEREYKNERHRLPLILRLYTRLVVYRVSCFKSRFNDFPKGNRVSSPEVIIIIIFPLPLSTNLSYRSLLNRENPNIICSRIEL